MKKPLKKGLTSLKCGCPLSELQRNQFNQGRSFQNDYFKMTILFGTLQNAGSKHYHNKKNDKSSVIFESIAKD